MSYGHISYGSLQTSDLLPAAPPFRLGQASNTTISAVVSIPTKPAADPPLPGYLELILAGVFAADDPFAGVAAEHLMDIPGCQAEILNLTDSDQGADIPHTFEIPPEKLGQKFWVAAVIRDEG